MSFFFTILSWDDYGAVTIKGGAGKDIYAIRNDENEAVILYDGDDGAKYIGNSKDNNPTLGSGNATAWGNDGDDKITASTSNTTAYGGTGSDIFVYVGGNMLIKDYSEIDKLRIQEGNIYNSVVSGDDVVLTVRYFNSNL